MTSEMGWFVYAENGIVNLSRLLAMMPDNTGGTTLLFDSGQTITVSKTAAASIVAALRLWDGTAAKEGATCLPQTM